MRRGLIGWSPAEIPEAEMEARVARTQAMMRAENLDALIAYTSFARPCTVSWLTQFVPYWNDGLVVIFPQGLPLMLAAFSKRVEPWIREVARVGDVIMSPNLGKAVIEMLNQRIPALATGKASIGMVDLDQLPWPVAETFQQAGVALVDATTQFAALRQPADKSELSQAVHALALANKALDAMPAGAKQASELLSAIDAVARLDGAEEVLMKIAPDLEGKAVLQRMESDARLGARHAIQVSLSYKSVWVRTARCLSAKPPASWAQAQQWFETAATKLNSDNLAQGPAVDGLKGKLKSWTLEACLGGHPLSAIAWENSNGRQSVHALPGGALAVLSVQLELPDGPWHGAAPLVLGGKGEPSQLLGHR